MLTKEARQILIHFNAWRRGQSDAPEMPDPKESGKAIDVAIEAMGDAWISVEDRLPEAGKEVLIFTYGQEKEQVVGRITFAGQWLMELGYNYGQWHPTANESIFKVVNVTHWQPLPPPPKAEQ